MTNKRGAEWLLIDDDPPQDGTLVLVSGFIEDNPDKGRWVEIAGFHEGDWRLQDLGIQCGFSEDELYPPTHWAPIEPLPGSEASKQ